MGGLRALVRTMLAALLAFGSLSIASAQDTPDQAPVADENLLDADTLDGLVAPIALYPDALLTQILVASTFPLDVVKAEHLVEDNADTADAARADLAAEEPWDESVRVLAGGFPQLVDRMADEIEWTETLGDAMLLQTDDLLDAVQRQRARAVATGYLDSNEAQTVDVQDDTVSIAPADPEVVYVPSYDPAQAFTSAPTAAPVVYGQDSGFSVGNTLATGAIAFGGAMILSEIFDDDDDDWDNYWRGPSIDWDDAEVFARPDITVDGNVNVGNRVRVDRDRSKIGNTIDRDNGSWRPSDEKRREARDRIAARDPGPDGRPKRDAARRDDTGGKLKASRDVDRDQARARLQARGTDGGGGSAAAVVRDRGPKDAALKHKKMGSRDVQAAVSRGKKSADKARLPSANSKAAAKVKARPSGRPNVAAGRKPVSKPKISRPATRHAPAKVSAFQKPSSSHKVRAASNRGHKSGGRMKKRR